MVTDAAAPTVLRHPLVDDLECPVIQYADVTLILLRAEDAQVRRLKVVLDDFAAATGLGINFSKSAFIPINVEEAHAATMVAILGCSVGGFPRHTLGFPSPTTRSPPVSSTTWLSRWNAASRGGVFTRSLEGPASP
jgi:hypothetical protein